MKTQYLIQDVDRPLFWRADTRKFHHYLMADKFDSEEELLEFVEKEDIGVFKITKVYGSK